MDEKRLKESIDVLRANARAHRREYESSGYLEECLIGVAEVFKTVKTAKADVDRLKQEELSLEQSVVDLRDAEKVAKAALQEAQQALIALRQESSDEVKVKEKKLAALEAAIAEKAGQFGAMIARELV